MSQYDLKLLKTKMSKKKNLKNKGKKLPVNELINNQHLLEIEHIRIFQYTV